MTEENYILISRILSGEADASEEKAFKSWLNASAGNREEFEKISSIWQKADSNMPKNIPSFESFWQEIEDRIAHSETNNALDSVSRKKLIYRIMAAAAILFAVVSTYLVFKNNTALKSIITEKGQYRSILLPDSSRITLNSSSAIQFDQDFDEAERKIHLNGQAFFKVKKDVKPFIVETGNALIEVLGTSFDVNNKSGQTVVIVEEGHVSLANIDQNKNIDLHKNQSASISKDGELSAPVPVDVVHELAWLDNILVFNKTSLTDVVQQLEQFYGIEIRLEKELVDLQLSGRFRNQSAREVIELLCLALNLQHRYENDQVTIYR